MRTSFSRAHVFTLERLLLLAALLAAGTVAYSASLGAPAPQPEGQQEQVEALVLTLRPTGFEPSEVTVSAGRYLFVVNNRTGLEQFTPRLEREGQGAVHEVRPLRLRRSWKHAQRLTPGSYVLSDAENAEWVCRINVTP